MTQSAFESFVIEAAFFLLVMWTETYTILIPRQFVSFHFRLYKRIMYTDEDESGRVIGGWLMMTMMAADAAADEPLRKIAHEVMIEEWSPAEGDNQSEQSTRHSDIVVNRRQLDIGAHLAVSVRNQLNDDARDRQYQQPFSLLQLDI